MEFHQIKYFIGLCDTLNFTRAAERCHVTQPSLTRAIKLLEDELGGPLFHRERNNTHLTELGRLMEPHLRQILAEIDAAKGEAKGIKDLSQSALTLGVMCTIGPTKLLDLIGRFRRKYPEVKLTLRDANGLTLQEMLLKGELEVAIFGLPEKLDRRLHQLPLFEESVVISFAPGHRFESLANVRCLDLDGEPYVCRANCEFAECAARIFAERGIAVNVSYISEREDWVLAMIKAGLGFGFTPEYALGLPGLITRPLVDPAFARTISVTTVRGRPHSTAVGAFVREAMAWRARGCPDALSKAA